MAMPGKDLMKKKYIAPQVQNVSAQKKGKEIGNVHPMEILPVFVILVVQLVMIANLLVVLQPVIV